MRKDRPYIAFYIFDLEDLYEANKNNPEVLDHILYELSFRSQRKRVLDLIEKIKGNTSSVTRHSDFEFNIYEFGVAVSKYTGSDQFVRIPTTYKGIKVVGIDKLAFYENESLVRLEMPDTIRWIEDSAFVGCESLEQVKVSSNLEKIGESAFAWCSELTHFAIPESVIEIGEYCFDECDHLTLTLPYKWIPNQFTSREDEEFSYDDGYRYQEVVEDTPDEDDEDDFDVDYEDEEDDTWEDDDDYEDDEIEPFESSFELYDWQEEALESWKANNYKGIIEAVTGAGKTHVALQAMLDHLQAGYKVAIVVPTITLLNQWYEKVNQILDLEDLDYIVHKMGDGNTWNQSCNVIIAVCNSAATNWLVEDDKKGLLIADECHRYGTEQWSAALEEGCSHRLGLTATLERQDEGIEDYLLPYFKKIVYTLGYEQALEEQVIANFKIGYLGVEFSEEERLKYDEIVAECSNLKSKLIKSHGVRPAPFGEFIKDVVELTGGSFVSPGTKTARKFIKLFSELKEMISSSTGKFNALETVTDAIMTSNRTIIFTQTIAAADKACKTLIDNDIDTGVIDSSMNRKERENVLEKFSSGAYQCIVSPKILDEGVDVPEADLAIIMSSSKSKRQMIQRMGRVIRKKTDGRIARVIILYIKDTVEDPTSELKFGNSDTFVDIIEEVADDIRYFDSYDYAINDYSNEFDGE